jgi:hypothetical protein
MSAVNNCLVIIGRCGVCRKKQKNAESDCWVGGTTSNLELDGATRSVSELQTEQLWADGTSRGSLELSSEDLDRFVQSVELCLQLGLACGNLQRT